MTHGREEFCKKYEEIKKATPNIETSRLISELERLVEAEEAKVEAERDYDFIEAAVSEIMKLRGVSDKLITWGARMARYRAEAEIGEMRRREKEKQKERIKGRLKLSYVIPMAALVCLMIAATISAYSYNNTERAPAETEAAPVKDEFGNYLPVPMEDYVSPEEFDYRLKLVYEDNFVGYKEYTELDSEKVRYAFDEDGTFLGVTVNPGLSEYRKAIINGTAKGISRVQAEEIAVKTAETLFGSALDEYGDIEFVECDTGTAYSTTYWFKYENRLGKDGFIEGYKCNISVREDGAVTNCRFQAGKGWRLGFDEALLEDIDKSVLDEYINEALKQSCGEYTVEQESEIYLVKHCGKYFLRTNVWIITQNEPSEIENQWIGMSVTYLGDEEKYRCCGHIYYPLEEGCEDITFKDIDAEIYEWFFKDK